MLDLPTPNSRQQGVASGEGRAEFVDSAARFGMQEERRDGEAPIEVRDRGGGFFPGQVRLGEQQQQRFDAVLFGGKRSSRRSSA